jgi:hypothetical protein
MRELRDGQWTSITFIAAAIVMGATGVFGMAALHTVGVEFFAGAMVFLMMIGVIVIWIDRRDEINEALAAIRQDEFSKAHHFWHAE